MAKGGLRQAVWDLPTRLFHWLLVGLIGFSWWSAETRRMDWHQLSGLAVCGLLAFRVLWGFLGASTARFSQFVRGPRAVWAYLRGRTPSTIGHNPLGGWSVIALLLALGAQVVSGLFAVDIDGIESGPLSYHVDFEQGRLAAQIHATSFNLLLGLIGLHVLAVLFYLVARRRNLIGAMITGSRKMDAEAGAAPVTRARWWRFASAVAAGVLLAWWIAKGARF
jgi:cytochrome b